MGIPEETHVPTQDESNTSAMSHLDDIIDLVTDQYIQWDMGGDVYDGGTDHHVYESAMYPWEWLVERGGYAGSPSEARDYYLSGNLAQETSDGQVIIQRQGAAFDTPDVFIKRKGEKWKEVRSWFEGIKKPYETALSFQQNAFISPEMRMGYAVDDLVPVGDITDDDVAELTNTDVGTENPDDSAISEDVQDRLNQNDQWSDARTANRFLEGWQGRGAQIFKWTFLERRPSILVGQATTAKALHEAVEILDSAYTNVRSEAYGRMYDAENIFELYPVHQGSSGGETDWPLLLNRVAGVATIGAGVAAWIPGGQGVAAAATIIAGGATLGANIVESPTHESQSQNEIKIEGDTVSDIYWNWYEQIQAFNNAVLNSEEVIGTNLTAFREFIDTCKSPDSVGASFETTFGDKVELTQYQSYFAPKGPGEGAFTPGSRDGMGPSSPNGDSGAAFSGDLNELFKAAVNHLPAVADVYGQQAGRGADENMTAATQRTVYESPPYGGESYASDSNGAALQPWLDLHAAFEEMMTKSETHFRAAAADLRAAAIEYRDGDDAAAAGIDDTFQELES